MPASSPELARDRRLDRFSRFDEPGERRVAAGRILRLAAEQQFPVMLSEHDDDRVGARIMLAIATAATARPAAPFGHGRLAADRAMAVTPVPVGKAERRPEDRRIIGIELTEQAEMRPGVGRHRTIGQGREARLAIGKPKEQRPFAVVERAPDQPPVGIDRGRAPLPLQRSRSRIAGQRRDPLGLGAKRIGAIEAWAGEEGLRRQSLGSAFRPPRRRHCDKASAARQRRSSRADATSRRPPARLGRPPPGRA